MNLSLAQPPVDITTASTAETTMTFNVTKPQGGNLMVVMLGSYKPGTITVPSGWQTSVAMVGSGFSCAIYYKVATYSEPTSYVFSGTTAAPFSGTFWEIQGQLAQIQSPAFFSANISGSYPCMGTPVQSPRAGSMFLWLAAMEQSGVPTFTPANSMNVDHIFSTNTVNYLSAARGSLARVVTPNNQTIYTPGGTFVFRNVGLANVAMVSAFIVPTPLVNAEPRKTLDVDADGIFNGGHITDSLWDMSHTNAP